MNKYRVYIKLDITGHWQVGRDLDSWTAGRLMRDLARTGRTCYAVSNTSGGTACAICHGVMPGYWPRIERPDGVTFCGLTPARLANV